MALPATHGDRALPLDVAVRRDRWWIKPLLTAVVLLAFIAYGTFRAFENRYYEYGPYLAPFYSPLLPLHLTIGGWAVSPALYILVFPLAFRVTCYYYRQAYYRAFFWDPPACAIPERRGRYRGEREFPLWLQNFHRYALYVALLFLVFLWWDTLRAFWWNGRPGMGLGSLLMLGNILLLTGYTFGCHSLRHLVGGRFDCFTCVHGGKLGEPRPAYSAWRFVSALNRNHQEWAWASLIGIALTDLYIRLVAAGTIVDPRFF